tara:strand:+ start:7563 stop:7850 length:288 start_codon:yes stop_codon:yes gene_type:complete
MAKISFAKGRESIEVEAGTNLMQALTKAGVPVASSCKGKLVCGKCYIEVVEGSYNLSSASEEERDFMDLKDIPSGCRMACACQIEGDVCLDTPYW